MTTEQAKQLSETATARLIQALEQGQSDALQAYLTVMSRFHRYSWLCWRQHSSDYIQLHAGDKATLAESLTFIQQTAALILEAIAPQPTVRPTPPPIETSARPLVGHFSN